MLVDKKPAARITQISMIIHKPRTVFCFMVSSTGPLSISTVIIYQESLGRSRLPYVYHSSIDILSFAGIFLLCVGWEVRGMFQLNLCSMEILPRGRTSMPPAGRQKKKPSVRAELPGVLRVDIFNPGSRWRGCRLRSRRVWWWWCCGRYRPSRRGHPQAVQRGFRR